MQDAGLADSARGLRHVFLRDIVLAAHIGVHAHEHGRAQRVRINVDLAVADDAAAVGQDELGRVVDYEAIAAAVRSIVASEHVKLVETLAERIAASCLQNQRVLIARIGVEKLDVFTDMGSAGVVVERRRG